MKKYLLPLIFFFSGNFLVFGQQHLPSNFFMTKLDNGLDVLVMEDSSVPLATIELCVKNGSYTEDSIYNGLSHLYEHMFFKANKDVPSQEAFLKKVNQLGIYFNGTTSNERVNYFFTLGSDKVAEGLKFMNSAIRYPLFDEQEMKNENPVVDGEFQRMESDPVYYLQDELDHKLWGNLYSRKNPIGDHEVILTASPEKMRVIQGKYYHPNNSLLVIAGDVKHEEIFEKVKNIFSDWKSSGVDPFTLWEIPEFQPMSRTSELTFVTVNENAQVPVVMMGWHGPDTRNDIPATYAADVFSEILGLASSEFQRELVDSGLADEVDVSYHTCKYTGPVEVYFVPNPDKLKPAMKKLASQISRWDAADYFTDEQLETAKNKLIISNEYEKESTSEYIHTVTYYWASASINYITTYNDQIRKVTRQQIQDYIRKYIKGQPVAAGILLSSQMKTDYVVESYNDLFK